ncbi:unnamed protein product [Didymodactylos carnosus]|uniref:Uncharacterized protein n=1 Tax=Didymodactylos carnosus TaxID=1234261 RepID=A0A814IP61_9BILA|nr:unnamed protein product [Didymodactylos carnosus]CAF3796519.1 unnamed protein product [Didymodactylos carnosus]
MGPSGSGKTPNMNHVMNAAFDVIHLFPKSYFADLLLQESDTFIYNDEIDGVFNKSGMFGNTTTEDIPVLCKAFDQIQNYERNYEQSSSLISLNNSRLSILGGTTGSTYSAVLKQFKNGQRLDGLCNRMVYLAIQREKAKEPMESFKVSSNDGIPSIKYILMVVHLMKNIKYRFRTHDSGMTRTTTTTTEGAVSTNTLGTNILDADSAYYYVYNRTAAHYNQLFDKNLKIERYLEGFYSKSQEIYPRFCSSSLIERNIFDKKFADYGINMNEHLEESIDSFYEHSKPQSKKTGELPLKIKDTNSLPSNRKHQYTEADKNQKLPAVTKKTRQSARVSTVK